MIILFFSQIKLTQSLERNTTLIFNAEYWDERMKYICIYNSSKHFIFNFHFAKMHPSLYFRKLGEFLNTSWIKIWGGGIPSGSSFISIQVVSSIIWCKQNSQWKGLNVAASSCYVKYKSSNSLDLETYLQ